MTTTIGSVTLDYDGVFANEFLDPRVTASVTPTLGGGVYVQEFPRVEDGREITLEGVLLTNATLTSLKALADVVNATYTLTITTDGNEFTKTIRFRNEVSGGALQFQPIAPFTGYPSGIHYTGTILMMVV